MFGFFCIIFTFCTVFHFFALYFTFWHRISKKLYYSFSCILLASKLVESGHLILLRAELNYKDHRLNPIESKAYCGRQRRIFIFSFGGVDKYLGGGGCCLLCLGPGGNARKGQGKSLTKFVF